MSALDHALRNATDVPAPVHDEILRFRVSERQMHWAIAIPFMICYSTAVILIAVYNPHPERPYRAVLSWIHRGSGLLLFAVPLFTLIQHWYDFAVHRENIREVWRWTVADIKWLFLIGPSTLSKKVVLPEQGKFNAAEKINFMALMSTLPLYLVSGLAIWFHQYVFSAWVLHLSLASVATVLMGGHIFMATVNPDTRVGLSGMITGYVSRHWAAHHYGIWYNDHFGHVHSAAENPVAPVPATGSAKASVSVPVASIDTIEQALSSVETVAGPNDVDHATPAGLAIEDERALRRQLRLVVPRSASGSRQLDRHSSTTAARADMKAMPSTARPGAKFESEMISSLRTAGDSTKITAVVDEFDEFAGNDSDRRQLPPFMYPSQPKLLTKAR